jgi:hypothetical protein
MIWSETSSQTLHKVNNKRWRIKQWLNSDFQFSSKLWENLEQLLCSETQNKVGHTETVTGNSTNCWFIRKSLYSTFVLTKKLPPPPSIMQPKDTLSCSQELTAVHCWTAFLSQGCTFILAGGPDRQISYAFFRVTRVYRFESLHAQFRSPFCSPIRARIHVHN